MEGSSTLQDDEAGSEDDRADSPHRSSISGAFGPNFSLPSSGSVPSSRVDRLLLQRIRKTQSNPMLYGEPVLPGPVPDEIPKASVYPLADHVMEQQRLIVIANRLPVSAFKQSDGSWSLQVSAGGLVSALMGVGNYKTMWIGWPGQIVDEGPERDALTAALARDSYHPVYLDAKMLDLHYNGFCNSVLWQLFHYVPLNIDSKLSETQTLAVQWNAHQAANEKFAEVVLQHYKVGDVVWVQDYHLMLLPAMLKERSPKMKVGWFLHTPFPSSEIYRTLPVREEVLRCVLKADLIGFHTYDYARHFVSACTRILGLEGTPEGVEDSGSLTRIAAFPIGIDPDRFSRALQTGEVSRSIELLRHEYGGRKVMLGVDRLDMIKGIPQKLLAFEKFLLEHPEWKDKVMLVQIAVPTRTEVPEYQRLRSMVHEIVGRINGRFSGLSKVPIIHLDRQLSFYELCALYAVTDVLLVTSLRDGMNLVSYEYVACQKENAGVLILSEFAGAAQSLGAGALLVNPWNITDVSNAIEDALNMSEEERFERHRQNYMHVTIHTAQTWADTFITELNDTHVEAELRTSHIPPELDIDGCVWDYRRAARRLVVLGYNATLTTSVEAPRQPKRHFDGIKAARPLHRVQSMTRINASVVESIRAIASDPTTTVLIFSGSDKGKLQEAFGDLNVWLAAENGVFFRPPPKNGRPEEWLSMVDTSKKEWMEAVQLVLDYFSERTPRSFVDARETSVVWNYKYADVEFGRLQARDLLQHLWTGPISNAPVDIVQGSKSVEVRPVGVSKGFTLGRMLRFIAERAGDSSVAYDFVLVAGHFLARDENIFTLFEGRLGGSSSSGSLPGLTALDAARGSHLGSSTSLGVLEQFTSKVGRPDESFGRLDGPGRLVATEPRSPWLPRSKTMTTERPPTAPHAPLLAASPSTSSPSATPWGGSRHGPGGGGGGPPGIMEAPSLPMQLPPKYLYTCSVGRGLSAARYHLNHSSEVAILLEQMSFVHHGRPLGVGTLKADILPAPGSAWRSSSSHSLSKTGMTLDTLSLSDGG